MVEDPRKEKLELALSIDERGELRSRSPGLLGALLRSPQIGGKTTVRDADDSD